MPIMPLDDVVVDARLRSKLILRESIVAEVRELFACALSRARK
jgi:hypothetical protein